MRRTHRAGLSTAAAAALLTGGGIAFASPRDTPPPAEIATVTVSTPDSQDLADLDAELKHLQSQAKDLKDQSARTKSTPRSDDPERATPTADPEVTPDATAPAPVATSAPATHATTGASGAGPTSTDDDTGVDGGDDD
jgi:hypothetical protein